MGKECRLGISHLNAEIPFIKNLVRGEIIFPVDTNEEQEGLWFRYIQQLQQDVISPQTHFAKGMYDGYAFSMIVRVTEDGNRHYLATKGMYAGFIMQQSEQDPVSFIPLRPLISRPSAVRLGLTIPESYSIATLMSKLYQLGFLVNYYSFQLNSRMLERRLNVPIYEITKDSVVKVLQYLENIYAQSHLMFLRGPACKYAETRWLNFIEMTGEIKSREITVRLPEIDDYIFKGEYPVIQKHHPGENTLLILKGPAAGFIADKHGNVIRPLSPLIEEQSNFVLKPAIFLEELRRKGLDVDEETFLHNASFIHSKIDK